MIESYESCGPYDSYEIYVSPAGIRVCSGGRDLPFIWDRVQPFELEYCRGHGTGEKNETAQ